MLRVLNPLVTSGWRPTAPLFLACLGWRVLLQEHVALAEDRLVSLGTTRHLRAILGELRGIRGKNPETLAEEEQLFGFVRKNMFLKKSRIFILG